MSGGINGFFMPESSGTLVVLLQIGGGWCPLVLLQPSDVSAITKTD